MIDFEDLQIFLVGCAALVDTALLFVLIERRNRPRLMLPLATLVLGTTLFHVGTFVHTYLVRAHWAEVLHGPAMIAMVLGLLLAPSAMLHLLWRMLATGFRTGLPPRARYALVYAPLLALAPGALWIAREPGGAFLTLVAPLVRPYVIWLVLVDLVAAATFIGLRRRLAEAWLRPFFVMVATALVVLAAVHGVIVLHALDAWPLAARELTLTVVLSPLLLVVLLAWAIVRWGVLELVVERVLLYGLVALAALFFHNVVLRHLHEEMSQTLRVDFLVIEGALLVMLVLLVQPLRERSAEALRYLFGARADVSRASTRRLSVELAALGGEPAQRVLARFDDALVEGFGLAFAASFVLAGPETVAVAHAHGPAPSGDVALDLRRALVRAERTWAERGRGESREIDDLLGEVGANLAVALDHPRVDGILILGRPRGARDLREEEVSALVMLAEQLAATVHAGSLQAERLAAERRALQNEKLSSIGLLASSIAHEVKNPLSSIKTIVSVLAEDLDGTEHAEDLRLVRGEIDRLTETVNGLLRFARPTNGTAGPTSLGDVVRATARLLRHEVERKDVTLAFDEIDGVPALRIGESALREIVTNLLGNAIDAVERGGRVDVSARSDETGVVIAVADDGVGVPAELLDRIFEPFETLKVGGTGLGLYVVAQRVREAGGEIACASLPGQGARFTVVLPRGETS